MWDLDSINKLNIEAAAKNISIDEINSFRDSHPEHDDRTDFEVACMIFAAQDKGDEWGMFANLPTPTYWDGTPYAA